MNLSFEKNGPLGQLVPLGTWGGEEEDTAVRTWHVPKKGQLMLIQEA